MRNIKIVLLVISTLFLYSINSVYGQDKNYNKNAIYGSVGTIGLYFSATAYYERIITQKKKLTSFVKIGNGAYATYGQSGKYLLIQYGILTGKKKHHLEIGAGGNYYYDVDNGSDYLPPLTLTIGWRLQKPEGNFVLRSGASWPEGFYIGTGVSF